MPVVNYLWNPLNDNIVREFDDAGTVIAEYTTEAGQFGNVVSQRRNGQDRVHHYDGQGSTLALTDAGGNVTDTYAYSAFGGVTSQTGSSVNPLQYIGQKGYYWDAETGEYDIRRRTFSPQRQRWLSPDPLSLLDSINAYQYVHNTSTSGIDSSGLGPDQFVAGDDVSPNMKALLEALAEPPITAKVARCPATYILLENPTRDTSTNGCSVPPFFKIKDKDNPTGLASFYAACKRHDECYATCGGTKEVCDREFVDGMVVSCLLSRLARIPGFNFDDCIRYALSYYVGVRGFGPWETSQKDACLCCRLCGPTNPCVNVLFVDPVPFPS